MDLNLQRIPWARKLKLKHLETFLVLHSAGSITSAAEQMHMTQPALSHWLADTESVIGVPLFVRGRKLQLTPAGEILRRHANRMLGDVQRIDQELKAVKSGLAGRLQVGCIHSAALTLVPQAIAALQSRHPKIVMRVEEGAMADLLDKLARREFDLVVGTIDLRAHRLGFMTEVLLEDVMRIVCRPGHPLAAKEPFSWKEATHYPWILPAPESLSRLRVEEAFARQHAVLAQPCTETISVAAIQSQLGRTDCLGAMSGLVADFYASLNLLTCLPLSPPIPFAEIGMVWQESSNLLLSELLDAIRASNSAQPR